MVTPGPDPRAQASARRRCVGDSATPRTWLVVGEKPGDNAQVRAIGEALGWPCETRRIVVKERWRVGKPRVRASLSHIDRRRSDALEPPWPDLLITIGRRLSMVALWVRARSRGHTRIVLVGQPRRLARRFDLIVASAQYPGRPRPNVVRLGLPLMRVDPQAVAAAAHAFAPRLAALPRPLTALLVGGPTTPLRFDTEVAIELAQRATATADGGTLFATTSRRTPDAVVEALAASLPPGSPLHRYGDSEENPYLALLGLADRFVVTTDSLSMMVEVARLGRPLALFALPSKRRAAWRRVRGKRDLGAIPRLLLMSGLAVRLGERFRPPAQPAADDLGLVVARIRALAAGADPASCAESAAVLV